MDKATQEKLLANVKNLNDKFRSNLPGRLEEIKINWAKAVENPQDEGIQRETYRSVHSLAGSAGTFGIPEVGQSARNLLNGIKEWQEDAPESNHPILQKIEQLLLEFEQVVTTAYNDSGKE